MLRYASAILLGATMAFLAFKILIEDEVARIVFEHIIHTQSVSQYIVALTLLALAILFSGGGGSDGDISGGTKSEVSPTIEKRGTKLVLGASHGTS